MTGDAVYLTAFRADRGGLGTEVEKRAITHALQLTKGSISAAAKKLKLGQATIYRKIKAYRIRL
ncbi:MAG: hypothetical protein JW889_00135 [Verrucomicrobia bacterium]|nr:hypothetical protein [Verrucomicrobiota bacterium]